MPLTNVLKLIQNFDEFFMGDETDVSAVPVHALQVINKVDKAVAHL
jgi:hypothetical protein